MLPIMSIPMLAWLFRQHRGARSSRVRDLDRVHALDVRVGDARVWCRQVHPLHLQGQPLRRRTILLLYVFNLSREAVPTERVITVLTIFWMYVVIWGALGVVFPTLNFTSPMEKVMPQRLVGNDFVHDLVHPALSQVQSILGLRRAATESALPVCHELGSGVRES